MAGSGVIVRGVFDKPLVQMIKEFGQGGNIGCSDTWNKICTGRTSVLIVSIFYLIS